MRIFYLLPMILSMYAQQKTEWCTLTLRVIDNSGKPGHYRVFSLVGQNGNEYATFFSGLKGRAPCDYGSYRLELRRTDVVGSAVAIVRDVFLSDRENWLTVKADSNVVLLPGGRLGAVDGQLRPDDFWKGRLEPIVGRSAWIQIREAFGSTGRSKLLEAEVDKNGEFRIYGKMPPGMYVLSVVTDEGRFVYLAPLVIRSSSPAEPLVVKLGSMPPGMVLE